MPLSHLMINEIDLLEMGMGLLFALLAAVIVAIGKISPNAHHWMGLKKPPTLVPIPILTQAEIKRRAVQLAARRRHFQDY